MEGVDSYFEERVTNIFLSIPLKCYENDLFINKVELKNALKSYHEGNYLKDANRDEVAIKDFNNLLDFLKEKNPLINFAKITLDTTYEEHNSVLKKVISEFETNYPSIFKKIDLQLTLGPLERFHPKYNGKYSCISYNKFLLDVYYLIYKISYEIENISDELLKLANIACVNYSEPFKAGDTAKESFLLMKEVLENAIFFPNEDAEQRFYNFDPEINKTIFTKKELPKIEAGLGWQCQHAMNGDNYSKSFKLPYYISTRG